jgi:hypothetical protein
MNDKTAATVARVRDLLLQANRLLEGVIEDSHSEDLRQAEDLEALQESVYGAMVDASKLIEA